MGTLRNQLGSNKNTIKEHPMHEDEKEARNTGTKYTLLPKSTVTYYLPPGTSVIATDGVYWDNPDPSYPEERFILVTEANTLLEIAVDDLAF